MLVGIALILRNVWVWLHYAILSTPRRGGRRLNLDRLTLETMLLWLLHQAEEVLRVDDTVEAERPMFQDLTTCIRQATSLLLLRGCELMPDHRRKSLFYRPSDALSDD